MQVGAQPARIGEYGKGNCRPRTPGRQQIEAQQLVFSGHDAAVASWQPEFGDGIAQVRDRAGQLALFLTHHALKCPRDAAEQTQAQHQGHSKIVTTNQLQLALEACPEGKLGDFARELSEGRRRRFVTRSAVGLCTIVFLTVGIRQLLPAAEVTCTETKFTSVVTLTHRSIRRHGNKSNNTCPIGLIASHSTRVVPQTAKPLASQTPETSASTFCCWTDNAVREMTAIPLKAPTSRSTPKVEARSVH